jgi:membrane protein required for colicin V production
VIALVLCFKFSGELAPAVEPVIAVDQPLKKWIAMAIVYLGLCLVSFVAAGILTSWLEKAQLKDFDRHLGALLGFLKGVIICMTAMFFGLTLSESTRALIGQSRSGYAAATIIHHLDPLLPLVPDGAQETVRNVVETFNRRLKQSDQPGRGGSSETPDDFTRSDDSWLPRNSEQERSPAGEPASSWWDKALSGTDSGRSSSSSQEKQRTDVSLSDLLGELPSDVREDLTSRAMQELRNTTEEQRQLLIERLRRTSPESASELLDDFVNHRSETPTRNPAGTGASRELSRANSGLLNQISEIYSNSDSVEAEARKFLTFVPEQVQRGVLEDWYADVMQFQNDPDPGTTGNTSIRERVLRQLDRSGVSMEKLDQTLRVRLGLSNR